MPAQKNNKNALPLAIISLLASQAYIIWMLCASGHSDDSLAEILPYEFILFIVSIFFFLRSGAGPVASGMMLACYIVCGLPLLFFCLTALLITSYPGTTQGW